MIFRVSVHLPDMTDYVHGVYFLLHIFVITPISYVTLPHTYPSFTKRDTAFMVYSLRRCVTAKARSYIPDSLAPPRGQAPLGLATLQAIDKKVEFLPLPPFPLLLPSALVLFGFGLIPWVSFAHFSYTALVSPPPFF